MQFELPTARPDAASLTAAVRALDPHARVTLDLDRGRMEVLASASIEQILDALARIGCVARPLEKEVHISGGSTCCGHCG
jgi:copper chaperone